MFSRTSRVTLAGADAATFAHAQLSTDVTGAADGSAHWSCLLTPQGRVVVVLRIARRAADAIDLYVPADRGEEIGTRLSRFVFRSKVKIALDESAWRAMPGTDASPTPALAEGIANDDDELAFRCWLVAREIPLLAGATVESQTPHALGLDRLQAISTTKGCYPGQEIVARTHFLGRNKRHLVRFESTDAAAPFAEGAELAIEGGGLAGHVILAVALESGRVGGLAVAHEQALHAARWLAPDGTPVMRSA